MTTSVRLGILSTAHLHADVYAPLLSELDGVEFVGIAGNDTERGQQFAVEHETSYESIDTLLDLADGVIICSSNADHHWWAERAAKAGVDVLSEKPLGRSVDEARAVVDTCTDAGVTLGVAMPLRFSRPVQEAKSELDAGRVGDIQAVSGTNRGKMPGDWFVDPEQSGGGAVMDHTVHIVDLVHWLTDERVAEVYAETATRFYDLPVEDINLLSMTLTDGTQFSLDGSWSRPENADRWGDATVEFFGTDANVAVDCFAQSFRHIDDRDESAGIHSVFWGDNANKGMLADFADAVREGHTPQTTGQEGVDAVAVTEAAYESAERGEAVKVNYK
ncbi:Gfo/Idh/MocA family protein [Haloprofundus salinisoli]|uniref:Gfo/Idh/MocA family protein n=1 Tax=Haloprofundus salinisoli TaxID=2876193 RepID=UPI001CCB892C|nr:Gfo/Idh/MocA family oxidoreductase [Haloprofundus salinisoli]